MLTWLPPTRSQPRMRLSNLLYILNYAVNLWRRLTPESLPVSIRLSIGIHVHRACHTSQFSRPRAGTGLVGQTPRYSPLAPSRQQDQGRRSPAWGWQVVLLMSALFPPPVLEVMTGPERSSLDVTYLTWHPDGGRGWGRGGHKKFSWHLQTSSSVTQHQQSRFHWTVSGASYFMGRSASIQSPSLHL